MKCITEERMLLWLDGGVAPNEVGALEAHVAGCADCRQSKRELETLVGDVGALAEVDAEAHVRSIRRRIAQGDVVAASFGPASRRMLSKRNAVVVAFGALAVAAATWIVARAGHDDDGTFASRGVDAGRGLARDVGVSIYVGRRDLARVSDGSPVKTDAAFTGAYTNVYGADVHLLLFAVDAKSTVHWLYPAYVNAHDDPTSVRLDRAERERLFTSSVVLDAPAKGPLRLVAVVTTAPLHVSNIETRAPSALTLQALAKDFPRASISEIRVVVESP